MAPSIFQSWGLALYNIRLLSSASTILKHNITNCWFLCTYSNFGRPFLILLLIGIIRNRHYIHNMILLATLAEGSHPAVVKPVWWSGWRCVGCSRAAHTPPSTPPHRRSTSALRSQRRGSANRNSWSDTHQNP